jgi:hypothetical protein
MKQSRIESQSTVCLVIGATAPVYGVELKFGLLVPLMKNCWNPILDWIRKVSDLRVS